MPEQPIVKRGGKRPGAGRPPALARQLQEAKKVARQLRQALALGLNDLVDAYPGLMQRAIQVAQDGDRNMLKFLLELPLRAGVSLDETAPSSPLRQLVQMMKVEGDLVVQKREAG